jgi:hypothetical protein
MTGGYQDSLDGRLSGQPGREVIMTEGYYDGRLS